MQLGVILSRRIEIVGDVIDQPALIQMRKIPLEVAAAHGGDMGDADRVPKIAQGIGEIGDILGVD